MSALAQIENKLKNAPNLKAALQENFVEERFVTNFQAVTGRTDGKTKFQSTFLSYMERIAEKPDLMNANRFSHFAAIVKIGRMGLPLEKLYIMPDGHGGIKVQSDPAGKRAQLEMMAEIKSVPEPQVILKGDEFAHDKLNNVIVKHISNHQGKDFTLDDIIASYTRIKYKDGSIIDTVVYHQDLVKAKAKSTTKSDAAFWGTFPAEAAKKTSINRAHRLYHKYPDTVLTYDDDKEDEETVDAGYASTQEDFVATESTQEVEEVATEDATSDGPPKKDKKESEDFIV